MTDDQYRICEQLEYLDEAMRFDCESIDWAKLRDEIRALPPRAYIYQMPTQHSWLYAEWVNRFFDVKDTSVTYDD